ncbi:hypothetical protein IWZ01DRAFT_485963 [Phyllosticta capitalensis]
MPNSEARSESNFSSDDSAILTPLSDCSQAYNGPPSVEKLADIVAEICNRLPLHRGGNFQQQSEQVAHMRGAIAAEAQDAFRLRNEVKRLSREVTGLKAENTDHVLRIAEMERLMAADRQESCKLRKDVENLSQDAMDLKKEKLDQQVQVTKLQNEAGLLREELVADLLRQLDREKESLKLLQMQKPDRQKEPDNAPPGERIAKSQSNHDEEPSNIRPEKNLPAIQNQLNDQKEIMARLIESNEDLLFDPQRVGFFDPDSLFSYKGSAHSGQKDGFVYYRNIELFIEAAEAAARTIPVRVLRNNLQHCLAGLARSWYISILTTDERDEAATGPGLANWASLLRKNRARLKTAREEENPPDVTDAPSSDSTKGDCGYSVMPTLFATLRLASEIRVDDQHELLLLFCYCLERGLRPIFPSPEFPRPQKGETTHDFMVRTDSYLRDMEFFSCQDGSI